MSEPTAKRCDPSDEARYSRQTRLTEIGRDGQDHISAARVAIVGCGALGSHAASGILRAGVRSLRLIDRDLIELSNLPRQPLFDERDACDALPKAVAAATALRRVDSRAIIDPIVADLNDSNAERLLSDCDMIIDGCDNYETRFLLNDLSVKRNIPWVYGGCVGTQGRMMLINPGGGPCLRCVFPEPPAPGAEGTCETIGILGTSAAVVASLQVTAALRWIIKRDRDVATEFVTIDVWRNEFRVNNLSRTRDAECPCCAKHNFEFLEGRRKKGLVELCGRGAVQVFATRDGVIDLAALHGQLKGLGELRLTPYFVQAKIDGFELSVFADGRAIIRGTTDSSVARSLYAKYVGN